MAAMAKASGTCTVEKRMAIVLQHSSGVSVQWSDHQENGKINEQRRQQPTRRK